MQACYFAININQLCNMKENLYKVLTPQEWQIANATGTITTELDSKDGFVHLSNASQLSATLALYFSDYNEVILLLLELKIIKDKLIYEAVNTRSTRSGKFAHLYAALKLQHISKSWILRREAFAIPQDILLEAEMDMLAD